MSMAAHFLQAALITSVFLLVSVIPGIHTSVLQIDVYNYTSPQVGSRVEFQCYGHAIQQRGGDEYFANGGKLVWLLDGVVIANSSTSKQSGQVSDDKYSPKSWKVEVHGTYSIYFSLTINHVSSVDDNGAYQCALYSGENTADITSYNTVNLIVQYPPSKLFPQCQVDSIQMESRLATLGCRSETAMPGVKLYWTTSAGVLAQASPTSSKYTAITVDVDIPATPSAEYICVANYTGDFEQVVRQCVIHPPRISLVSAVVAIEGGDARFTCSVSAVPESEQGVMWTAVPPLSVKNTTISLNDRNSVSELTVRNVTARENGTMIWCHSRNVLGENRARSVMTVRVFGSPPGTYIPPIRVKVEPPIAEILAGDTATFTCDVSTISSTYKYKWYYKDKEINSESENTRFWIDQQRLRISEVSLADSYKYVACEVTADGHTVTARATLNVLVPATIPPPMTPKASTNDSSNDFFTEYGTLIGLISGGLVSIVLIIMFVWMIIKSKRKCSGGKRNQHQVHTINDAVSYSASIGGLTSFNNVMNESRPVSPSSDNMPGPFNQSAFSCSSPPIKTTNEQRGLVINLPPIPQIPLQGAVGEGDTLRAAKKLAQLEDYETMETIQSNLYSSMTAAAGNNEYQHVIDVPWRSNSRPNGGDDLNTNVDDDDLLPGQRLNNPALWRSDSRPNGNSDLNTNAGEDLLPGQRMNNQSGALVRSNSRPNGSTELNTNKPAEPLY